MNGWEMDGPAIQNSVKNFEGMMPAIWKADEKISNRWCQLFEQPMK